MVRILQILFDLILETGKIPSTFRKEETFCIKNIIEQSAKTIVQ